MDPDDLANGADESDFALKGEGGVGHEGFGEDVLDEPEHDANVDVFDVEGDSSFLAGVHHSSPGLVAVRFVLVE